MASSEVILSKVFIRILFIRVLNLSIPSFLFMNISGKKSPKWTAKLINNLEFKEGMHKRFVCLKNVVFTLKIIRNFILPISYSYAGFAYLFTQKISQTPIFLCAKNSHRTFYQLRVDCINTHLH